MITLSEERLRELLCDAWGDGFTESMMYGGVAANDKQEECQRDVDEIIKGLED